MNIIVFTDIHGHTHNLTALVPMIEKADMAFFLGDGLTAMEVLPSKLNKKIVAVIGNCDPKLNIPTEALIEVAGRKIMIAHGHTYDVKSGMGGIVAAGRRAGADLVLFGHTHKWAERIEDDMITLNIPPIGTSRTKEGGSYLDLHVVGGQIKYKLCKII